MSTSLKDLAACIGLPSELSVLRDFYGFREGKIPTVAGGTDTLSLKEQFNLLQGRHIHINIIHVGDIGSDDETFIDQCLHQCRCIYATVNLGVGRVKHFVVTEAEADGNDVIGSESEKYDLLGAWSVPGSGIDLFMVKDITYDSVIGSAGYIADDCDDEPASDEDGVIVDVNDADQRTFAHELGHFLGLEHTCGEFPDCDAPCDLDNLMTQTGCITGDALDLTSSQGSTMRCHFKVRSGC